jgi:glycosyltransferase involved in cell wall biosynthesis
MKIAQVCHIDFALHHFLLPLMRGARDRGHEVVGICAEGPLLAQARAEGFRIITVPMARSLNPLRQSRALLELLRVFAAEEFDLVHGHFPISGLLARIAARRNGVRRIAYTCHGFLFNQPGPWSRRKLSLVLERFGGRLTDAFFCVSEEEAREARALGIHPRAIGIGNGRDPAIFHPDPDARARIRAELGVPDDRVVITAMSRIVRHKGYPELLQAMEWVPDAELWIVGERLATDHGETMEAEFAAAHEKLGPRLRLLGYRRDTAAILAASDIFTLPSLFEGLPMSIIEAMLTGLPVVSTDIRGPREQVVDGQTGYLIPPTRIEPLAGALTVLARNAELRAQMGEAGRRRALDLFDEKRIIRRTLDLMGL